MLRFQNTLTGRLDPFEPVAPPRVGLYCCGPTVYTFAHIGNFRTFVFEDILNRYLRSKGFDVNYVMNVTDIDDKTIRDSRAAGMSLSDFTKRYTATFLEDLETLRVKRPDTLCPATEHIPEMEALVRNLLDKGLAYVSEGSVYFKIDAFPGYGKLSKKDFTGIRDGARVDSDEYEKENARDFVLWKGSREGEPSWEAPFGAGRPGWHLECSAMSLKYLGDSFDLHCGGTDLVFPHHENEIAQSEGATGKPFVKYWLHSEYLIVNGEKMSKSKGNFFTLRDLVARGHNPLAIRYLLLSVPYRKPLNFTEEGVGQAQAALDRIHDFVDTLGRKALEPGETEAVAEACREFLHRFEEGLDDDLNTSAGLAALFDFIRENNRRLAEGGVRAGDRERILQALRRIDEVLDVLNPCRMETPADDEAQILDLVRQREEARRGKDWKRSDALRDALKNMGISIKDTPEGTVWKRERP
ncbi:MAG: cysteine--tRNA ligase [Acidobacteria bacterium]|nr:cysteine--tRNA ligase [Acidobacteriota bacterium]